MVASDKKKIEENQHEIISNLTTLKNNHNQVQMSIETGNCERIDKPKSILSNTYVKEVKRVYNELKNSSKEIENLINPITVNAEYLNNLRKANENSTKLLLSVNSLLDLNTFIKIQIENCKPNSSLTRDVVFKFGKGIYKDSTEKIYVNDDTYTISIKKLDEKDLYEIEFEWTNSPIIWKYDLKISIFYNLDQENFTLLKDCPFFIKANEKSKMICKFKLSELSLSSKASDPALQIIKYLYNSLKNWRKSLHKQIKTFYIPSKLFKESKK